MSKKILFLLVNLSSCFTFGNYSNYVKAYDNTITQMNKDDSINRYSSTKKASLSSINDTYLFPNSNVDSYKEDVYKFNNMEVPYLKSFIYGNNEKYQVNKSISVVDDKDKRKDSSGNIYKCLLVEYVSDVLELNSRMIVPYCGAIDSSKIKEFTINISNTIETSSSEGIKLSAGFEIFGVGGNVSAGFSTEQSSSKTESFACTYTFKQNEKKTYSLLETTYYQNVCLCVIRPDLKKIKYGFLWMKKYYEFNGWEYEYVRFSSFKYSLFELE